MPVIRYAEPSDGPAIGLVHVRAWQAAYRGLMPDGFLDGLDAEERGDIWTAALARGDANPLVIEDGPGIAGIAGVHAYRDDPDSGLGELGMINLAPEAWGKGMGRLLLEASVDELRWQGYQEAVLWVLETNQRARGFYEHLGWHADGGAKEDEHRGFLVREVRYRRSLAAGRNDLWLDATPDADSQVQAILNLYDDAARRMASTGIEQWSRGELPADRVHDLIARGETTVLRAGMEPAACCILAFSDAEAWDDASGEAGAAYVHDLIVARGHAGRGLGRRLLQRAERRAAAVGRTRMRLECVTSNGVLRRYYERAGYRYVGETDFGHPEWRPGALYERDLPAARPPAPTA